MNCVHILLMHGREKINLSIDSNIITINEIQDIKLCGHHHVHQNYF